MNGNLEFSRKDKLLMAKQSFGTNTQTVSEKGQRKLVMTGYRINEKPSPEHHHESEVNVFNEAIHSLALRSIICIILFLCVLSMKQLKIQYGDMNPKNVSKVISVNDNKDSVNKYFGYFKKESIQKAWKELE